MEPDGMDLWKTTFLYKPVAFMFHVGLFQSVTKSKLSGGYPRQLVAFD